VEGIEPDNYFEVRLESPASNEPVSMTEQENVKVYASQSLNDLDFSKSPYDLEISTHLRS
jgi:hypothetical protein